MKIISYRIHILAWIGNPALSKVVSNNADYNARNFEQNQQNKIFYRLNGLALMLFVANGTTSKNIDLKIHM